MKIDKIEIQTSNKNHAIDIAILVDKKTFMPEIKRLREKWEITELKKLMTYPPIQELLNIDNIILKEITDREELQKRRDEFSKDVDELLKKFNRGKNFKSVITYAIATGVIPEGIYQSCYFDVVTINEAEDMSKPEKYQYVIVLSPRTEKQEVEDVFAEFKEHIENKIKFESRSLPKLKESGNLITDQEIQEFAKLTALIEVAYRKYKEKAKNLPISEDIKEYTKFAENTQDMRNRLDVLSQKIPLTSDNPTDMDLIEQYHRGNIYDSALIEVGSRMILDRTREWYWMRFGEYINGNSKKAKTHEEVAEEWNMKCPDYPTKDEIHIKSCEYCHVNASNISHALSTYDKLLEQ